MQETASRHCTTETVRRRRPTPLPLALRITFMTRRQSSRVRRVTPRPRRDEPDDALAGSGLQQRPKRTITSFDAAHLHAAFDWRPTRRKSFCSVPSPLSRRSSSSAAGTSLRDQVLGRHGDRSRSRDSSTLHP